MTKILPPDVFYECGECGEEHERWHDAVECCPPEVWEMHRCQCGATFSPHAKCPNCSDLLDRYNEMMRSQP